jgi:hypothetical protein
MNIFLNNNFDPHIFDQYTKAIVVGKGPTFKAITKPDENTLLMGVNHAIDFLINPDALLCQDLEFFDDFSVNTLAKLKYVATPHRPHVGLVKAANGKNFQKKGEGHDATNHKPVIPYLSRAGFEGIYIPYLNLHRHDGTYKTGTMHWSSGCRAVQFVRAFMLNVKEIETYGIASSKNCEGHHTNFAGKSDGSAYIRGYDKTVRRTIEGVCASGGIKLIMH